MDFVNLGDPKSNLFKVLRTTAQANIYTMISTICE